MIGFEFIISSIYGEPEVTEEPVVTDNYYEPFKLPINYLDEKYVHKLSQTVELDLELATSENKSMYEYLFQPKHEFARSEEHTSELQSH